MKIELPVKQIVADYLRTHYKDSHTHNITITSTDVVGIFFVNLLTKHKAKGPARYPKKATKIITIELPEVTRARFGQFLTPQGVKTFNQYIDKLIKDDLKNHMETCRLTKIKIIDALELFIDKHNIQPNSWDIESIRRQYQRFK